MQIAAWPSASLSQACLRQLLRNEEDCQVEHRTYTGVPAWASGGKVMRPSMLASTSNPTTCLHHVPLGIALAFLFAAVVLNFVACAVYLHKPLESFLLHVGLQKPLPKFACDFTNPVNCNASSRNISLLLLLTSAAAFLHSLQYGSVLKPDHAAH